MFVCICNALRHNDLQKAAAHPSVKGAACVFKACEAKPKCGRCLPDVAEMIAVSRPLPDGAAAAAE